jgi:hypothetical protein
MFKHYFELIQDVEIWPIISLVLFFVFFSFIVARVLTTDRQQIRELETLPFDDGELEEPSSTK